MDDGTTPFFISCERGHLDIVKILLIQDHIDIHIRWCNLTPANQAKIVASSSKESWETEEEYQRQQQNCPLIVKLIEKYESNPEETKFELKRELGILGKGFYFYLFIYLFIVIFCIFYIFLCLFD